MRTRDKSLSDYGVPLEDARKLYSLCADVKYRESLETAVCSAIPNGIRTAIYIALAQRIGYRNATELVDVYCTRKDFYGYKRKAAAEFYKKLKESGEWEKERE